MQTVPVPETADGVTPAEKPAVLVVDDERGPRESIAFILEAEFSIDSAERASDALRMVREKEYAAIVLDIRMPEMDGIQALEAIRKIDSEVSVIMLTGFGTLQTAQQAMLQGANQYLRKPPNVDEVLDSVRKQSRNTAERRKQSRIHRQALLLNAALKQELAQAEPKIWQARASAELVHDLTNPLMVTIGYASLLGEEAKSLYQTDPQKCQKLVEYAAMVGKAAEYAHYLAENWRQASAPSQALEKLDLVQTLQELHQVIFFNHPAIQLSGEGCLVVRGVKFQLMRVFQNLLKNAMEAGATRISIHFADTEKGPLVTLADNGKGMTPDEREKVEKGSYTSKVGGMGLGMNICRHILSAHGATFELKSQQGVGSTISMQFPKSLI